MTKNSRAANACKISVLLLFSSILLGCNFAPSYQQPQDVVAATVPDATPAPALAPAVLAAAQADALQWLADDRLRHTVALALHNNRDLRIAADNVAKARAQYGIARADQLPSITAQLQGQRSRSSADVSNSTRLVNEQVSASIGFASYEVDLWGRIRNLNAAAWQQFLQVQENRRGVEIALIAEVANAWLTLAADQERLALAQQTLDTREQSYALMRRMFQLGATSGLALAQNLGTVETARGDVALYTAQLARSRNALQLLVGAALAAEALPPAGWLQAPAQAVWPALPQALPSSVLLARPDVQAAEHALIAQHAHIGQPDGQHRQQQYGTGCAVYRGQPHLEFCPRRAFAHFFGGAVARWAASGASQPAHRPGPVRKNRADRLPGSGRCAGRSRPMGRAFGGAKRCGTHSAEGASAVRGPL